MDQLVTTISTDIHRLKKAISNQDEEQIDRCVETLSRHLIKGEQYQQIGDERLLKDAYRLLVKSYDDESKSRLFRLTNHISIVTETNNKLYDVLNPEISLNELLYLYLDRWPQLGEPIGCNFDGSIIEELKAARDESYTVLKLEEFFTLYLDYLEKESFTNIVNAIQKPIELALESYKRLKEWNVQALFFVEEMGDVYSLKIKAKPGGIGSIDALNIIDTDMDKAAKEAITCIKHIYPYVQSWDFTWDIERGDIPLAGNSIGLALTIGMLAEVEGFDIDPFTAFTGQVEWDTGAVRGVGELKYKLAAARELGIRRVFIPRENSESIDIPGLLIVRVGSVEETRNSLQISRFESGDIPIERLVDVKIRQLEIVLRSKGVRRVIPIQDADFHRRVIFSNFQEEVVVDIYYGKGGIKPVFQLKESELRNVIKDVCDQVFGSRPIIGQEKGIRASASREKYHVRDIDIQEKIEHYIFELPESMREIEQNCKYRSKIIKSQQVVYVRQFLNGTLTIEGPPPLFAEINSMIRSILCLTENNSEDGQTKLSALENQIEAVKTIVLGEQWIGTDEAGKGDYYGPLVGAAVLVDKKIAQILEELGVKDSKELSDKKNRELADKINQVCGKRAQVVAIPPSRYNALYEEFQREKKNLNTLLAWAHTRALEDILSAYPQKQITVIVDKFADEHYIQSKLLEKSRQTNLNIVQLPKAEANIAVAAASILARAQYLILLERLSKQIGIDLPKGSSNPLITQVGKKIITELGRDKLAEVAKLHFKTTKDIIK
jgi:ribonuclease HIII